MQNEASQKKSAKPLWILLIITAIPIFFSWLLYHYHASFQFKTVNYGTIVNPPLLADYLSTSTDSHQARVWQILYVSDKTCDNNCKTIVFDLHQVQKALGKDQQRVKVMQVTSDYAPLVKLQQVFSQRGYRAFVISQKIYLIDPAGNLFMYYPSNTDLMHVLKDLKRVLEVSQIG